MEDKKLDETQTAREKVAVTKEKFINAVLTSFDDPRVARKLVDVVLNPPSQEQSQPTIGKFTAALKVQAPVKKPVQEETLAANRDLAEIVDRALNESTVALAQSGGTDDLEHNFNGPIPKKYVSSEKPVHTEKDATFWENIARAGDSSKGKGGR